MDPILLRCHDYPFLMRRWRKVARAARLEMTAFAEADGFPVWRLASSGADEGGVYLSAGIHGDEPAATEGLIGWAEQNIPLLRRVPCLVFPCLNPWGLVHNTRTDAEGQDLNRTFQHDGVPHIGALKAYLQTRRFRLALTLHEDFDGRGLYLYELERRVPFWGEDLVEIARPLIPIEGRTLIDGRRATRAGLMRRKLTAAVLRRFPALPEAVYLHLHHTVRTFTFETPSEFALDQRVRVQVALIAECVRRMEREAEAAPKRG
ncbi:MAG: M14 family metallocarboxypeptidase [Chthoniobacteraceae bacterium]|nr:M14 family metallocarboxypeptidase [Chthoniobacteraceae bacterium]